jgi:hypothetical protein
VVAVVVVVLVVVDGGNLDRRENDTLELLLGVDERMDDSVMKVDVEGKEGETEEEEEEINNDNAADDDDGGSSPLPARVAVNNRKQGKKLDVTA